MRLFFMLSVAVLALSACDKPKEMSVEESSIVNAFSGLVSAGVYDGLCAGAKLSKMDKKDPAFVNYNGNRQMFLTRLSSFWAARYPDKSAEENITALIDSENRIAIKAGEAIKKEGCKGEAATFGKNMLHIYTNSGPKQVEAMINKTIVEQGGTVTKAKPEK